MADKGAVGAGGAVALDGSLNNVGAIVAASGPFVAPGTFTLAKNGYVFTLRVDGKFLDSNAGVYYSGASCTGTAYTYANVVGDVIYPKTVIYKPLSNSLFEFGGVVGGLSVAIAPPAFLSYDSAGGVCSATTNAGIPAVWQMTPVAPAALGVTASGNPLAVASPVKVQ
jgi:hypothetical protein